MVHYLKKFFPSKNGIRRLVRLQRKAIAVGKKTNPHIWAYLLDESIADTLALVVVPQAT
jgi:hypothetical protein